MMQSRRFRPRALLLALASLLAPGWLSSPAAAAEPVALAPGDEGGARELAEADLEFALEALERKCGHFFSRKNIDWKKVAKELRKEVKEVESESDHLALLVRLLARLRDGHAEVRPGAKRGSGAELPWPEEWRQKRVGLGLMFCSSDKKLYVRNAWSTAAESGIEPGWEIVKVDGVKATKWMDELIAETSDRASFSTEQHARYGTWRWGLTRPPGTRMKFELKAGKKSKKRTLTFDDAKTYIDGPAVVPEGTVFVGRSIAWGKTPGGNGYLHVRRVSDDVIGELDQALAALGPVPGLVADWRGNAGGGCDHDAFEARFVPRGQELKRLARDPLASQGATPYGGPMVVIVDGTVVSAGETTSGMFKEDGRAYMIGESPTAGMSSQKETIELPSGQFALYVSVRSNRSSFNGGQGIEGIGVAPHELVEYDPEELGEGIDTMIRRADELLAKFPQKDVRYDPADYGWKAPQ